MALKAVDAVLGVMQLARPRRRRRECRHVLNGQDVIDIQEDDKLSVDLAHSPDEVRTDMGTESGRRLDLGGRNVQD